MAARLSRRCVVQMHQLSLSVCFIVISIALFECSRVSEALVPSFRRNRCRVVQHTSLGERSISLDNGSSPTDQDIGIGIDLGTTCSAVAVLEEGIPTIIPIHNNGRTMPSVVSWDESSQEFLVGQSAIAHEVENPLGSYRNVKRILGAGVTMAREMAEVVPNLVVRDSESKPKRQKGKKEMSLTKQVQEAREAPALLYCPPSGHEGQRNVMEPEVISAQILQTLIRTAEQSTGKQVTRAVVGVPAYFHDAQRDATVKACQLAGISKVKLLREPEAAALAYGIGKEQIGQGEQHELVLVFDLGGGTFDVSMLVVGGGLTEILCTSGNAKLGGSDFDVRIADHLLRVLQEHTGGRNELTDGGEAADAMVRASEAVRIHLSNNRRAYLALPLETGGWINLANARDILVPKFDTEAPERGISNSTHVLYEMSRKTMESLCQDEFQALLRPIREVSIMSGALLPGDARPGVVEAAFEMEGEFARAMGDASAGAPAAFEDFYKDEEGRALATQASVASPRDVQDVDQKTLLQLQEFDMKERKHAQQKGRKRARNVAKQERKFREEKRKVDSEADIKVIDGISGRPISQVVLVGGATRMPGIGRLLAAMTGVVPQRTVNPDEAVALGCAVHVGVLDGDKDLNGLTVITPMQAAIMRAVAEKNGLLDGRDDDFDDEEFDTVKLF